jgi:hypothetical protein
MPTINCQIEVGETQRIFPFELIFEDAKPFVILESDDENVKSVKIPLDESRLVKPVLGLATYGYKGNLFELRPPQK